MSTRRARDEHATGTATMLSFICLAACLSSLIEGIGRSFLGAHLTLAVARMMC